MARKRFIDPSFWSDGAVGKLSAVERLFFVGCFSNADDEGRLPGNPAYLRSTIFPYDDLTLDDVRAMRDRVASLCKNFCVYAVDEDDYIAFRRWRDYQSPRYPQPSKFPAPPWEQDCGTPADSPEKSLTQGCDHTDATLPQDCVNDESMGSGWDQVRDQDQIGDQVRDGDHHETSSAIPSDTTPRERLILHELRQIPRYPLDIPRDLEYIRVIEVDFPTIDLLAEVKRFRAYLMDHPLQKKSNPRLRLRNWCENETKWQRERSGRNGRSGTHSQGSRAGKYDNLVIR